MESVNVESGIPAIYQYIPKEPIVLSPYIEITKDPKQQEIDNLREFTGKQNDVIQKLITKQDTLEQTIVQQNLLLEKIISRLGK